MQKLTARKKDKTPRRTDAVGTMKHQRDSPLRLLCFTSSKSSHASTHGRPTNERCDERSAGVADWKTARRVNTERTLTAAAGPSPCDPYRHSLAMRPSQKARPFRTLPHNPVAVVTHQTSKTTLLHIPPIENTVFGKQRECIPPQKTQ